jgi:hypothetical protein
MRSLPLGNDCSSQVCHPDLFSQATERLTMHREHIYRGHRIVPYCKRCWKIFKSQEQLDFHMIVEASEICDVKPGSPPEGITVEHERHLRSRKKTSPNQTDCDRWKDIYKILFPNEEVPSPCELFQPPAKLFSH